VSRWKHDLDDEDRANLAHLMNLGEVLEHHTPQSIIDWNKNLNSVKPTAKKKQKSRHSRRKRG
jgi:hypothetical protein